MLVGVLFGDGSGIRQSRVLAAMAPKNARSRFVKHDTLAPSASIPTLNTPSRFAKHDSTPATPSPSDSASSMSYAPSSSPGGSIYSPSQDASSYVGPATTTDAIPPLTDTAPADSAQVAPDGSGEVAQAQGNAFSRYGVVAVLSLVVFLYFKKKKRSQV